MSNFTKKQSVVVFDKIMPAVTEARIMVEFPQGTYKTPFYPKGKGVKQKLKGGGWKIEGQPVAQRTPKIDGDGIVVKFNKELFHIVGMHKARGETIFNAVRA